MPFCSNYNKDMNKTSIDVINQSIYDFMLSFDKHKKGGRAIAFKDKEISFAKLYVQIEKMAGSLTAMGIEKGDCVAICLPNIPQAVVLFYAVNSIGAIASMVHPRTSAKEFAEQIEITKPKLAVLTEANFGKFRPHLKKTKLAVCSMFGINLGFKSAVTPNIQKASGEEIAVYMHSGGTTGKSKTVALSNKAFNSLVFNLLDSLGNPFTTHDTLLAVLPMFHGFGLAVGVHVALSAKMTSALVPIFDAKTVVKFMLKTKTTAMIVIPRILEKLLREESFSGEVVKNLSYVYVGGDGLSERVRENFDLRMRENGSNAVVRQGYGLTETASVCTLNYDSVVANSVGKPLHNVEFKIVDDNLKELKTGEVGELILKCEQVMSCYLKDTLITKKTFCEIDGQKWLKTGDFMSCDEENNLYFKGRKKRLIKISGMNVFPNEIETIARKRKEIKECVAVERMKGGVPYIALVMVLMKGYVLDENLKEDLRDYFEKNVSMWSIPRAYDAVESLPYTNFGKIDFKAVK